MQKYPITVWVPGKPATQGSKRIMPNHALMKAKKATKQLNGDLYIKIKEIPIYTFVLDADPKNKVWRAHVKETVGLEAGKPLIDGPVLCVATFFRPRPGSHFLKSGELSLNGKRNPKPCTAPDSIKMMRSVEDALQGVLWTNDSRITTHVIKKEYAEESGLLLSVWPDDGRVNVQIK